MMGKCVKKVTALLLAVCILVLQLSVCASAENTYPCFATVRQYNGNGFTYAYTEAGTKSPSEKIDEKIYDGTTVKVLAEEKDSDNDLWYKVQFGEKYEKEGYIFHRHLSRIIEYTEDKEFEKWIDEQKFPETYKEKLRNLHMLYPKWKFYADHIEHSWEAVIKRQTEIGVKTVHQSKPDSWKSAEEDAFTADGELINWSGYVPASKTIIEYYTDPRNFLYENSIFIFFSHSYNEALDTQENLKVVLDGTFMDGALPDDEKILYSDAIITAAKTAKLSPFVIASTILQEQGSATAGSISGKSPGYEGYYNYFNIGATDALGVKGGLQYASAKGTEEAPASYGRPWNTAQKSITGGSLWYVKGYVSKGQDTYYYMDFDVRDSSLGTHQYASNIQDAIGKTNFLTKAYAKVLDSELAFYIPVYEGMPEVTALPVEEGNNNNYLKALEIKGQKIDFSKTQLSYELIVNYECEAIEITAEAEYPEATISGTGKKELKVGNNSFEIIVTATSGEKRIYTIDINRKKKAEEIKTPTIKGKYKIGDFITGVELETDISKFAENLKVENGTIKVFALEKEKTEGTIATGDVVKIYDTAQKERAIYTVCVLGDTSGDGRLTAKDLLMGQQHILKISTLKGASLSAIDIDKDGTVKSRDLLMGQRHILKISEIVQ